MAGESETKMDVENDLDKYGEDVTPAKDGGVRKIIKKEGNGDRPPIGSKAKVYYAGTLLDGQEFDSNIGRKDPFEFELGRGVVIQGWDVAISTMRLGEISQFTIWPNYAYGKDGSGDKIPPNATLQFQIELVEWKGEDVTKDGQVTKLTFEKGEGYDKPNIGATCEAHIVGKYNGKVFEDREVSFLMREGSEEGLLPGVEEAILKMCSGEKAQIFIFPGKWGFGKSGKPEFGIPENASLEYVIHLKKFENSKENWELSNDEKISSAETTKEKGTKYFKKGKYKVASQQYARVVRLLDGYFSNEEKEKRDPLLIAGHLNLAACHLKLNNNFKCIKECEKALQMDKKSVKALFRRGKARIAVDELDLAKEDFQQALELDPGNKEAQQQLQLVNKKIRLHTAKEKSIYANMFERLARQEEQETGHEERKDVFQEAVDKETEAQTNSLSMNDQVASSTEVNGEADEEMKEDDKGGIVC
ncbi:peptidyl-prolyl cis-trans isomerase FKBP4-like [Montipora foliosa]|uniref:peptidyl-prolyl cis-trans isomerase FKBP4-like n=1 Tax=Montipora foliosa TaxID=591990 RepID=UPI0035F1FB4B